MPFDLDQLGKCVTVSRYLQLPAFPFPAKLSQ